MEKPKTCPFCGAKLEDYDHWMYKHPENDCYLIAVYLVQTKPVEAPGPSGIKVLKAEVIESRLPT